MRLERNVTRMCKLEDKEVIESCATFSERISGVWDVTAEVWEIATKGKINAESRLQRDVVSFTRPES
jgi:hypothetical protein